MDKEMSITNILMAGVGGQGIILASDILCRLMLEAGFDVKKSEVHGMAQRGGSVTSHVRFGKHVYSPLIKQGEVDILMAFEKLEALRYLHWLRPGAKYSSIVLSRGACRQIRRARTARVRRRRSEPAGQDPPLVAEIAWRCYTHSTPGGDVQAHRVVRGRNPVKTIERGQRFSHVVAENDRAQGSLHHSRQPRWQSQRQPHDQSGLGLGRNG